MHFSLEKLVNFEGNRYELAKACMEYAKKVRFLEPDEYQKVGKKDTLVALKHILNEEVRYHRDEKEVLLEEEDLDEAFRRRNEEVAQPDETES